MCSPRPEAGFNALRSLAAIFAAALTAASVSAQLFPSDNRKQIPVEIQRVAFGFAGIIPSETWAPLTVWLKGGEKGFSGALIIEYDQDSTQAARIIVPAAATPGATVPVQATVCVPQYLRKITITAIDQEGRTADKTELSAFAGPDRKTWDATIIPGGGIVYQLGDLSLERVIPPRSAITAARVDARPLGVGLPPEKRYLEQLRFAKSADAPPFHWSAYSGLALLAVRADEAEKLDPRSLEAVYRWVSAGGRLLIVASRPGAAWRRWLPPGELGDVIDLLDLRRVKTPPALRDAVASTREFLALNVTPISDDFVGPERPCIPVPAAPDVLARAIVPSKRGASLGWRSRMCQDEAEEGLHLASGLLAEGPVGFGWVTIVGFEPDTSAAIIDKPTSIAVWENICSGALKAFAQGNTDEDRERYSQYYYFGPGTSSAPTGASCAALGSILDTICSVSPPRVAFFIVIGGFVLALGILLGPVDRLLLRRANLPHWSWATALLWISLASAAAAVAPSLIRSDGTKLARSRIVDSLPLGSSGDGTRAVAWRTGVTSIFTDGSGTFRLEVPDAASWWRGVGASAWYGNERMRGFSPVECTQSLPTPGAPPPGCVPGLLSQGQWTLRCLQDDGPEPRIVNASFFQDRTGPALRVNGLPAGTRLVAAAAQVKAGAVPLESADAATDSNWVMRPTLPLSNPNAAVNVWKNVHAENLYLPSRRTQAIDAMIASGRWACLSLTVEESAPDISVSTSASQTMTSTYRVLVPYAGELEDPAP